MMMNAVVSARSSAFMRGESRLLQRQQTQTVQRQGMCGLTIEAAHKKGAGSTKNGRDSVSKRRGVKVYGGQPVPAGGIIIRQLGTKVGDKVAHSIDFEIILIMRWSVAVERSC